MIVNRVTSLAEYLNHRHRTETIRASCRDLEDSLSPKWRRPFLVRGWSYPARRQVWFRVDFSRLPDGTVNWREQLRCPVTKLNNRMRAAVQLFDMICGPYADERIYLSEQVTPLFQIFKRRYLDVIGSEFLGAKAASGSTNAHGVRHEDLTRLSFPAAAFDHMLSFDCLEHVPDYVGAIKEVHRVLKPNGRFVLSVPFNCQAETNLQRARLLPDGSVEHLLPPEYHGDPLSQAGCLSYRVFGWELLENLREIGFSDVYAMLYWSRSFGYLGEDQVLFVAKK